MACSKVCRSAASTLSRSSGWMRSSQRESFSIQRSIGKPSSRSIWGLRYRNGASAVKSAM
jgi:hypothetical protein